MTEEQAAMLDAQLSIFSSALRALIASHPDPAALRQAWNGEMALLWPEISRAYGGNLSSPAAERVRAYQARFESLIRDAKT